MRRFKIVLSATLILTSLWAITPAAAQEESYCYRGDINYTNESPDEVTIYVTLFDPIQRTTVGRSESVERLDPGETVEDTIERTADAGTDLNFVYSTQRLADGTNIDGIVGSFVGASVIDPCRIFNDGRLNYEDAAAPVIVYNENDVRFSFYAVDQANGVGTEILSIPVAQIRPVLAQAVESGENLLITERLGVAVYALSAGTCQMNVFQPDGKLYEFEWRCDI